jgi:hypothetical protein
VLVLAVVMYAFIVESLGRAFAPFHGLAPDVNLGVLRIVLVAMAVANLGVARLLRHRLRLAPTPALAITPTRRTSPLVQRLFTERLVDLVLSESIAVYGLVLFLLGGRPLDFYGFAALSLVAFAVYFPRLSQWEDRAREQRRPAA